MGTWYLDPVKREEVALKISRTLKKIPYNENFFEEIDSEEKAYWLGYMYADGCVVIEPHSAGGNTYLAALTSIDEDIIVKYARAINYPIERVKHYVYNGGCYDVIVTNKKFVQDLNKWGCVPRKTKKLKELPKIQDNLMQHFVRGYFDGDGSIFIQCGHLAFGVCGTKDFVENIQNLLIEKCKLRKTKIAHSEVAGDVYSVEYNGNRQCARIFNWLYQGASIYMERKRKRFEDFLLRDEKAILPGGEVSWFQFSESYSKILKTFDSPEKDKTFTVEISTNEFTALCPLTKFPDYYTLCIRYSPDKKCVESKSAKFYFHSFRNSGMFIEALANRIADDWVAVCSPKVFNLVLTMNPRGGIPITVEVER